MSSGEDGSDLTWVNGRAYRNEARQPNPKYNVTTADMARIRERYIEGCLFRQTLSDLALIRVIEAAQILNRLKEG